MKKSHLRVTVLLLCAALFSMLCMSFVDEFDTYMHISQQDVVFSVPEGFPAPDYSIDSNTPTAAGFTLGRSLFYDPILSGDYMTSCASCHQRFAAFAHIDHALSHGALGAIGNRNVPALQNLAWKSTFMHDGGITHLDLQPIAPITNAIEMNESLANVLTKLRADSAYRRMFREAFGDTTISTSRMLKSLSQFLVLMISSNSRYDKVQRHETQFTEQEQHGYELFKATCAGCHTEPLFSDDSFRNIGLPIDTSLHDTGRERITGRAADRNSFIVPSLRNVERTYPYMHDGRFHTLRQVLDFYTSDSGLSSGADPMLMPARSLSDNDKTDVILFLKTLTDEQFLHDRRFADPHRY